jgi:glucosylceramidase
MLTDDTTMKTYAQYLIKFVTSYAALTPPITIEAIAPQNEPNYATAYPSCLWATSTYVTFVGKYLGPAMNKAGLSTKIMLATMSNADSGKDPAILTGVLNDATAKPFIQIIGMQWGMEADMSTATASKLPVWQTEHKAGNYPFNVTGENPGPATAFNSKMAPNDQGYGAESWGLIRDWIKAGATSYSAWNMILDTVGISIATGNPWPQNALLTVDTTARKLNITPAYYVFRHLSEFVVPGAHVVPTTGGDAVAFKNMDGSIIVMMYNSGSSPKTMTVAVGGQKLQFGMPASGFATINYVP